MGCELPVFVITANISAVSSDPVFSDTASKGLTDSICKVCFRAMASKMVCLQQHLPPMAPSTGMLVSTQASGWLTQVY